jgi:hypothetical protein
VRPYNCFVNSTDQAGSSATTVSLGKLRLLAEVNGTFYKVARIGWAANDASIYVLPYLPARDAVAYAGLMKVPAPGESGTFDMSRQLRGTRQPKLSLHESGRTHGSLDVGDTPPVFGRPLTDPLCGHVATIFTTDVTGQPTVETPRGGPDLDVVFRPSIADSAAVNLALVIHASDDAAKANGAKCWLTLNRLTISRPLVVGVHGRVPSLPAVKGVVAFGGWGPGNDPRPLTGVYVTTARRQAADGPPSEVA